MLGCNVDSLWVHVDDRYGACCVHVVIGMVPVV